MIIGSLTQTKRFEILHPDFKKVYRLFSRENCKALADVITCHDEIIDDSANYEIFDPEYTWKRKDVYDFYAKELLVKIFDKGECIYESPDVHEIKKYCEEQVGHLWDEVLRFENPHNYYVDLSQKLWDKKQNLLKKYSMN